MGLCPTCNSEVQDVARGSWRCRSGHLIDYQALLRDAGGDDEKAQEGLPYKDWGQVRGQRCSHTFFCCSFRCSYFLGLPVNDSTSASLLVTMKADAAKAAFGSFSVEHMEARCFL